MARILVIDDEEVVRFTVAKILRLEGHDVVEAEDGDQGIARQKEGSFNLVISDLIMPEKEGLATIQELRHRYPSLKILAITGGGALQSRKYLDQATKSGADRTLLKPFSNDDLLRTVNQCLDG